MALGYFEQLLRKTSKEEQEEIEDFVGENESFTIHTHLARRVQPAQSTLLSYPKGKPGPTLKKASNSTPSASSEHNENARTGLSWAMALARIEFASVLAAFTEATDPYVAVRPTKFELPAYKQLLLDGVATHYWTLAKDPAVKQVSKISPSNPVILAFTRRLSLSRKMLRGLAKAAVGEFQPIQYRELAKWNRDLDGLHFGMLLAIEDYLQAITVQNTIRGESEREFVEACRRQLLAEQDELRRGTAKVTNYETSSGN